MKVAIALSCLLALASARSALKLRQDEPEPLGPEEVKNFFKDHLAGFAEKIRVQLEKASTALSEVKNGEEASEEIGKILSAIDPDTEKHAELLKKMDEGFRRLKLGGVKGRNSCHILFKILKNMAGALCSKESKLEFTLEDFTNVLRGNFYCVEVRLEMMQDEGESGETGQSARRLRRDLAELLRQLTGDRPKPTGDRPRPNGDGPRPTGDGPRPTGDGPRPTRDSFESGDRSDGDRRRPKGSEEMGGGRGKPRKGGQGSEEMGGGRGKPRKGGQTEKREGDETNPFEGMNSEEAGRKIRKDQEDTIKLQHAMVSKFSDFKAAEMHYKEVEGVLSQIHACRALEDADTGAEAKALRELLYKARELSNMMQ